jgi:hypothetical protein
MAYLLFIGAIIGLGLWLVIDGALDIIESLNEWTHDGN